MTWYDDYVAIWDALVALVRELTNADSTHVFAEENVFYGEKYPPDNYPSCYVCSMPISVVPVTFLQSSHTYTFEFGVVTTNPETKQGYLDAFELIGKIYDALVADRHLGGKVCDLEPTLIIPNWRGLGSGVEGFWVGLQVKLTKIRA